ncbi:hypothetical protein VTO73DRAFT_10358 [Trametes versicolor]
MSRLSCIYHRRVRPSRCECRKTRARDILIVRRAEIVLRTCPRLKGFRSLPSAQRTACCATPFSTSGSSWYVVCMSHVRDVCLVQFSNQGSTVISSALGLLLPPPPQSEMTDTDTSATERRFTMPRCDAGTQVSNMGGPVATTSPSINPGNEEDLNTPRGPPHPIVVAEAHETRGALANWHTRKPHSATTAQHTEGANTAASPRTSPSIKSATFRYPDGNIRIKADATDYKLHSSCLARYCVYFKKLFADDADNYEDRDPVHIY